MVDEVDSLTQNQTWVLAKLPLGKHALKSKLVFKVKLGTRATNMGLKAILIAHKLEQKERIDYHEIFTPVVCRSTLSLIIVLANFLRVGKSITWMWI